MPRQSSAVSVAAINDRPASLVEVLEWRAATTGSEPVYTVIASDGKSEDCVTYAELDRGARGVAEGLAALRTEGAPVILALSPGRPFVTALMGCFYAGALAVPAFPPRPGAQQARFRAILRDAGARLVVTHADLVPSIRACLVEDSHVRVLALEECQSGDLARATEIDPETPAVIQYTSGSTGSPKGVIITHGNLMHNLETIRCEFRHDFGKPYGVIWLPPYHDMGLLGGVLHAVYVGSRTVLMTPSAFLRRPIAWLQAIHRYGAVTSGGPTFAYDLCVRKTTPEERAALDLSSWQLAFCGSEPVRADVLRAFARAFEPSGFRPEAFYPCYGLAESTLFVTGGTKGRGAREYSFELAELERGRARPLDARAPKALTLVSAGRPVGGQSVAIVDPMTREGLGEGEVGEVWIAGPSVAAGYWQKPEETLATFGAERAHAPGRYLRTGDLGFFHDGELFVTGRLKELIIIRGLNHYPQDIEATVQSVSPLLRQGRGVAFSLERKDGEELVIVQELAVPSGSSMGELLPKLAERVLEVHGIVPAAIVLVARGSVPVTSSGKLMRRETKNAYLERTLTQRGMWKRPQGSFGGRRDEARDWLPGEDGTAAPTLDLGDAGSIETFIIDQLVEKLGRSPEEVSPEHSFAQLGLDSLTALTLVGELERAASRAIPTDLLYEQPTIRGLARALALRRADELAEQSSIVPVTSMR